MEEEEQMLDNTNPSLSRRTALKLLGATSVAGSLGVSSVGASEDGSSKTESFDPVEATATDVYDSIVNGSASAVEITQTYLDRIDAYDEVLNTVITLNDNALDRAEELDTLLEEEGPVGPLHGVPIVVKDIYDTADMPTTGGSLALAHSQPSSDADFVERLREAGAIVLAKSNTQEFARGSETFSSLGGQTRNPYNVDRHPGGSSGGSGAAVGANLAVFGTASDTGGSTRSPAMTQNLIGLRPTVGLASQSGIIPISSNYDTPGVVTRTVEETAIVFDLTTGFDPNNPITARSIGNIPTEDSKHEYNSYEDALEEDALEDARIGVYRDLFGTEYDEIGGEEIDEEDEEAAAKVTEVTDNALLEMEELGATIVDPVSIAPIEKVREISDEADSVPAQEYQDLNAYFDSLDEDAPINSVDEFVESGLYVCEMADQMQTLVDAPQETREADVREATGLRNELRDLILQTMAEKELDAILYPTNARPRVEIGKSAEASRRGISPDADMPAISIPVGFLEESGLPTGVDLLGRPFDEATLLRLAYAFEQGTDHRHPPDGFGELPGDPPTPTLNKEIKIARDGCGCD